MRISSFLIMIAVIGLFVGVFATFYTGVGTYYSKSYDNTTLETFNKYEELANTTADINDSITTVTQGNAIDVVGGLLTGGYTVLKNTWEGLGFFNEIADTGVKEARLGATETYFRGAIVLIAFILFIFAIIAVLTGRDNI